MSINKKEVNGILLLDKPPGTTSNGALQQVKRIFQAKKAGHGGSLDPIATGMLPIGLGHGTKFLGHALNLDKTYQLKARLGIRTDSGDCEGKVIAEKAVPIINAEALENYLVPFRGEISQIPSMFSAIKIKGKPLYELARQGIEIERPARQVTVYELKLLSLELPFLELEIKASKGTYMRSIVDDLGEVLGCGAHIVELRRIKVGHFEAHQMVSLETLAQMKEIARAVIHPEIDSETLNGNEPAENLCLRKSLESCLLPIDQFMTSFPNLKLSEAAAYYLCKGQPVIVPFAPAQGWVRLVNNDRFIGIGEILDDGRVAPRRLVK